jgi:hypothetical protein
MVRVMQGMKDLNLRDEARFQQAPQPEISTQVRCWVKPGPLSRDGVLLRQQL